MLFDDLIQAIENSGMEVISQDSNKQTVWTIIGMISVRGDKFYIHDTEEYFEDILDLEAYLQNK